MVINFDSDLITKPIEQDPRFLLKSPTREALHKVNLDFRYLSEKMV